MKFTIVGDVCIDKNSVEGASYTSFGGPAMYMNMVLSKFEDADVTIIANYGKDFEQYKSNIKFLPENPISRDSLQYQNIVDGGVRKQLAHNHHYSMIEVSDSELKNALKDTDFLIFAPLIPNYAPEYVKSILDMAGKDTVKLGLPQGYFRQFDDEGKVSFRPFNEIDEIVPLFDFVVFSDEDYPDIMNLAKKWSKKYKTDFIITRGGDGADLHYGADWMHDDHVINIPTQDIEDIVDSTGSGDSFSGAFAYMYSKTKDAAKSIAFANKVAGFLLQFTPDQMKTVELPV